MLKALYEAIRRDAKPEQIVLDELTYTTGKVYPVLEEQPSCLNVTTLTALVDYLKSNVDGLNLGTLLCHVESPEYVAILSNLSDNGFNQRKAFVRAKLEQLQLNLNCFMGGEAFNILLQSCFVEPEDPMKATDRGLVIKYASNVTTTVEANTEDDGVTQAVTVKKGIAGKGVDVLPNPVRLRPYRTFTEVEQPESSFVFRCKDNDGVKFALVEADGGAWKGEAMKNIKAFMKENVPGLNVIA